MKVKIWSKYAPKRTKLHHLIKVIVKKLSPPPKSWLRPCSIMWSRDDCQPRTMWVRSGGGGGGARLGAHPLHEKYFFYLWRNSMLFHDIRLYTSIFLFFWNVTNYAVILNFVGFIVYTWLNMYSCTLSKGGDRGLPPPPPPLEMLKV